ncbi:MAG: transcription elongation factor GreA [Candidatus Latescibacteria bacterium]|nr:transcription elongation factor GreA [Candidatus Latescibacterota bacterium]
MNIINVTRDGEKKLHEELKHFKEVRRPHVIHALKEARRKGDLSENAEYDAAREEQRLVESRINQLEQMIRNVRIIDESRIADDKAYVGARVDLKDVDSGEELFYILVNEVEADFKARKISTVSPIGKSLLGKSVGESVEITIPKGTLRYTITKISR